MDLSWTLKKIEYKLFLMSLERSIRPRRLRDYVVEKHDFIKQNLNKVYLDFDKRSVQFQGTEFFKIRINKNVCVNIRISRSQSKVLEGMIVIDKKTSRVYHVSGTNISKELYHPITKIYEGDSFSITFSPGRRY